MEGESKVGRTVLKNVEFRLQVPEKFGKMERVLFDGTLR